MESETLFAMHARFRAGEPLPEAWYRAGEALDEGVWAVDLDLFVEVTLSEAAWEELRGGTLELALGDTVFEIEVPEDASFDEVWTLEGCGLFEPEPGTGEEQPDETQEAGTDEGHRGDLHVVPVVS
jgi:hypothetical protein